MYLAEKEMSARSGALQPMIAIMPENETERLEALRQTGLLDSSPENEFDSLTRLAAVICGAPIALISLIDKDRQWFKSNVGLESIPETSRDIAFCAHTIGQADLFVVPDATKDPRFARNPLVLNDPSIRFYAGAPLETEDGLRLGSLCVIDRHPRELTPQQYEGLRLLAEQANKQINLRLQQRLLEGAVAQGTVIEKELRASQALFHAFMDNSPFVGFMKDASGRMAYYNQRCADRFQIDRQAWLGKTDEELWPAEVAVKLRANDQAVLRQWTTMVFEERANPSEDSDNHWRSYKFPFRDSLGREYVATFAVDITADKLAEEQIRNYQHALEEANERLLALSVTDSLTGLGNRRAFEAAFDREFAVASRYNQALSLLVADIDNFKLFNDSYGHEEGDRVLRFVAEIVRKCFRTTDFCARYGGEEFAILLPNTSKQSAAESAERFRLAVADCDLDGRSIRVSVGLATLESISGVREDLFRRADDALYAAKRSGKNQVCVAR
jgi:diguanylate cyclase (GGDEF)-like protein/PAS domain S-box-containing protein